VMLATNNPAFKGLLLRLRNKLLPSGAKKRKGGRADGIS
ncbi:MAG TPA: amino acid ABC transporter permease, partial [Clostridiales bacterium]|nr:amino acid ABC transporter permease [Clostridiales bacterium]